MNNPVPAPILWCESKGSANQPCRRIVKIANRRTLRRSTVLEVGLNLGCTSELALGRKVGLCRLISLVSADNLAIYFQTKHLS